jgi:acetylornithine/succinyldiaminopimelate/putrescine aminotransferase
MQCEGGDRYSSSRFHQGLVNLAESYDVPLIYDEIQTGLHLGRQFFWHRQFNLHDRLDHPTGPCMIVTAKKAQVGVVISRFPIRYQETFCPASLMRGYATASMLDQFDDQINRIETNVRENLSKLVLGYRGLIHCPRAQGLAFAFDFHDAKKLEQFVSARFRHGLLFYPAGKHTARFRLNLAFRDPELSLLWQQLDRCLADVMGTDPNPQFRLTEPLEIKLPADTETNYQLHQTLIASKRSAEGISDVSRVRDYVATNVLSIFDSACDIVILSRDNYPEYRDRILQMQAQVYEPARQTPPEEFDLLFADGSSIDSQAFLILNENRIVAMAFAGELKRFVQERGVASDPYVDDPTTFYMVDLTVAKSYRGRLGRILKSAITMLAQINGVTAIHGRNRDHLARGMWAINLSLGSFELQHLVDDYPDEHQHRDCIYYRAPIMWNTSPAPVSGPVPYLPLDSGQLSDGFFGRNLPSMVNKVCLSNFVDKGFLDDLSEVSRVLPEKLRHVYTASGLPEAIDKITKAIWRKRAPRTGLITIEGCYFGETGFLSRSLSNVGRPYFEVLRLAADDLTSRLSQAISTDRWLALYLDPHVAGRVKGITQEILRTCIGICREAGVPVVMNETGTEFGTERQFSHMDGMLPDAGVAWLGGQVALAYTHGEYFANDPLLLISTWDGDAYALARYAEALRQHRCGSMNLVSQN